MQWIVVTLFASMLFSIVNFIDKYLIEARVKDYRGMIVYTSLIGFLFGSAWFVFSGFPVLSKKDTVIVLFTGMLMVWHMALYFKALSLETVSNIILFFEVTPVFVLIFAFLFLGERLDISQMIGFVLVFFAVVAASLRKNEETKKHCWLSVSFLYILLASLFAATAATLIKFTVQENSFSSILCYESWGVGVGGLLLFLLSSSAREAFVENFRTVGKKVVMVIFVNEAIFVLARVLLLYAYSIGPLALVSVLSGVNIFFGILFGLILAFFAPTIFQEKNVSLEVLKKVTLGGIALFGIWLIQN